MTPRRRRAFRARPSLVDDTRHRQGGAALVLVLSVALFLALVALTLSFTVTLNGLATRYALDAAVAEGQAEGGLALAVRSLYATPGPDTLPPLPSLLRSLGWSVEIARAPVSTDVVRVNVVAHVGRARRVRSIDAGTGTRSVQVLARE